MKTEKELTVSEKNAELREMLWQMGLQVFTVGQLGRIDYLVVSHFEPNPNGPPSMPISEEDVANKDHKNLFLSNP